MGNWSIGSDIILATHNWPLSRYRSAEVSHATVTALLFINISSGQCQKIASFMVQHNFGQLSVIFFVIWLNNRITCSDVSAIQIVSLYSYVLLLGRVILPLYNLLLAYTSNILNDQNSYWKILCGIWIPDDYINYCEGPWIGKYLHSLNDLLLIYFTIYPHDMTVRLIHSLFNTNTCSLYFSIITSLL